MKHTLELRIVSRPVIPGHHFHGRRFNAGDLLAELHIQIGQINTCHGGDLIPAIPQGGQLQRQRAQP